MHAVCAQAVCGRAACASIRAMHERAVRVQEMCASALYERRVREREGCTNVYAMCELGMREREGALTYTLCVYRTSESMVSTNMIEAITTTTTMTRGGPHHSDYLQSRIILHISYCISLIDIFPCSAIMRGLSTISLVIHCPCAVQRRRSHNSYQHSAQSEKPPCPIDTRPLVFCATPAPSQQGQIRPDATRSRTGSSLRAAVLTGVQRNAQTYVWVDVRAIVRSGV